MSDYADQPWVGRVADRWGHYGPEMLSTSVLGVILLGVHPLAGPLMLTVPVTLMAFVIASWLLMRQHDRRLCEQCMLAMPLNPSQRATRYRRRFWLAHSAGKPLVVVPYLVVLIGSNFAIDTIGRIGWAIIQSTMVYLILSYATHRRLQPWCPWCRGGDGGGGRDDEDVTPPPPPVDRRQLI
ncbi:MAG: hypothetical protein ACRDWT_18230 [Jatrophihabitantaceae bacterium]